MKTGTASTAKAQTLITGRCHCGNIAFELDWEGDPPRIPARACGCSFCEKHGGVWTSNPKSRLAVAIRDPARLSKYAFGTRTATFHVCAQCGIVPYVTCEMDDRLSGPMFGRPERRPRGAQARPTVRVDEWWLRRVNRVLHVSPRRRLLVQST